MLRVRDRRYREPLTPDPGSPRGRALLRDRAMLLAIRPATAGSVGATAQLVSVSAADAQSLYRGVYRAIRAGVGEFGMYLADEVRGPAIEVASQERCESGLT